MAIENHNIPTFNLNHVYVVDKDDDNAERRMLQEAIVKKVSITNKGNVSFTFQIAGSTTPEDSDSLTIYYDVNAYKSHGTVVSQTYTTVSTLLHQLGIQDARFSIIKPTITSTPLIIPKGYIINDKTLVEAVDFPNPWNFERVISTSGSISETWTHNANFNGLADSEIYATREEALQGHKVKILRLNGTEDEV